MKIKPKQLDFGDDPGFGKHDLFRRKDFADRLTNLVKNIEDPTIFLLDAQWGAGKTTFLNQWKGELRTAGIPVIKFDAFERDYQEDPFISLSAEIVAAAKKMGTWRDLRIKFVDRASSLGKVFLSIAAQTAVSKASLGFLSRADVKDLGKALAEEFSPKLKERLEAAEANAELLSSFHEALEKLAKGMSLKSSEERKLPLVLIVDELDRCRPSFAVELIEKIKHVFSVRGVHFVLSAHLPQLAKIFQHSHGLGEEEQALIYLEKFYDVRIRFPTPPSSSETDTKLYIQYLWNELKLPTENPVTQIQDVLECAFQNRDVSLRTIEKIMTNIALYYAELPPNGGENIVFVSGVCCIRHLDIALYDKIASSNITLDDINGFFDFDTWSQEGFSPIVGDWWRLLFDRLHDRTPQTEFDSSVIETIQGKADVLLPRIASQIDNY